MKQPMKLRQADDIAPRSINGQAQRYRGSQCAQMAAKDRSITRPVTPRITAAEERVLQRVTQGETNKEIAVALGISPATVKRHLEKILSKLGLRNRVELAVFGLTSNSCPHHSISGCALGRFESES